MTQYLKYLPKALFSLAIGASTIMKLTQAAPLVESFGAMGYPSFLLTILGAAYLLGVVGIWQPVNATIKEWAFAGFVIAMVGAFASHILAGDPITAALPSLVLLALVAGSYWIEKRH